MIRNNDFSRMWQEIGPAVHEALEQVGARGWYVLGCEVECFENELAELCEVAHVVGVASGLDALEIGLRVLGLQRGERVLTTPLSAFATTLAIVRAGGVPVFVDVDERGLIDLDLIEGVLRRERDIKWLVPVHLYGHALDLDRLSVLRREFGLFVVEDCAQAVGAKWLERQVGTVGQLAALSFYPTKNLGALGDGGALLTSDSELASRARRFRHYGQSATYVHDMLGSNSRLDELQAALLRRVMLPRLATWTRRRQEIAASYRTALPSKRVRVPAESPGSKSVWHLFPVLVEAAYRESFRRHLSALGVESGVHYPRLVCEQRALVGDGVFEVRGKLDRAHEFASSEVSLPIHPLLSDEEVSAVVAAASCFEPAASG